jgi:hypothetical protein
MLGSGGIAPPFLTSALDGREWSASRPCLFTPGERAPGTHLIISWVCLRARLDVIKREQSFPCLESNAGRPARCYTDWAIWALNYTHKHTFRATVGFESVFPIFEWAKAKGDRFDLSLHVHGELHREREMVSVRENQCNSRWEFKGKSLHLLYKHSYY